MSDAPTKWHIRTGRHPIVPLEQAHEPEDAERVPTFARAAFRCHAVVVEWHEDMGLVYVCYRDKHGGRYACDVDMVEIREAEQRQPSGMDDLAHELVVSAEDYAEQVRHGPD